MSLEAEAETRLTTIAPDLVQAISQPSSAFEPDNSMVKQIRSMDNLSDADLKCGLGMAQRLLTNATVEHISALRVERGKLAHDIQKLEQSNELARIRLANMRRHVPDQMRGGICKLVMQRWSLEEATEKLAGVEGVDIPQQQQQQAADVEVLREVDSILGNAPWLNGGLVRP